VGITGFLVLKMKTLGKQKKTAGCPAVFKRFERLSGATQKSLYRRMRVRTKSNQNKTMLGAWLEM
jgi:hypothetical protein